jgi:hypothetical protein
MLHSYGMEARVAVFGRGARGESWPTSCRWEEHGKMAAHWEEHGKLEAAIAWASHPQCAGGRQGTQSPART